MFENTLKFKEEAASVEKDFESMLDSVDNSDDLPKVWNACAKRYNALAECIVNAFYEETKEYNSLDTLRSVYLKKEKMALTELEPFVNMKPVSFLKWVGEHND